MPVLHNPEPSLPQIISDPPHQPIFQRLLSRTHVHPSSCAFDPAVVTRHLLTLTPEQLSPAAAPDVLGMVHQSFHDEAGRQLARFVFSMLHGRDPDLVVVDDLCVLNWCLQPVDKGEIMLILFPVPMYAWIPLNHIREKQESCSDFDNRIPPTDADADVFVAQECGSERGCLK